MSPHKLLLIVPLVFAVPALAQGTKGGATGGGATQPQRPMAGGRNAVVIQPSTNNIFRDPIGQGIAPAAQANGNRNIISTSPSR